MWFSFMFSAQEKQENSHFPLNVLAQIINSLAFIFLKVSWNKNLHTSSQEIGIGKKRELKCVNLLVSYRKELSIAGK